MRRLVAVVIATASAVSSCGNGEGPSRGDRGSRSSQRGNEALVDGRGTIVARVDGVGIARSEVEALAREGGLSPAVALERLIERELLVGAARRAGLDREPAVRAETQRAATRALLEREVSRLSEADVPAEMVDEAYARDRRRFDAPELRTVVHVLGELPRGGNRETGLAKSRRAIMALADPFGSATIEQLLSLNGATREGTSLRVERIERFARDDAYEQPFLEASFALRSPGDVSPPVETIYGWHLVRLIEIAPPRTTPRAERDATLRRELLGAFRRRRAQELMREIEQRVGVTRDEEAIRSALAHDPLQPASNAPP